VKPLAPRLRGFGRCYNRTDAATSVALEKETRLWGTGGRSPQLSRPLRLLREESGERARQFITESDQQRGRGVGQRVLLKLGCRPEIK